MTPNESAEYCLNEVRRHDHDRYLASLFLPAETRAHAFAFQAFNLEIARTREIVSEPLLGQIRLQWWRETIEGIYAGTPREHPVVAALEAAIEACAIDQATLIALIDAREADLDDGPPPDLAGLEAYAEATSGALAMLVMKTTGGETTDCRDAAKDIGTAWALIGLARSVAFHARHQRLYIPEDLLTAYEVERRSLFDLKPSPALNNAVRRITDVAASRLARARALGKDMGKAQRRALLPGVLAGRQIARMEQAGFDPFAFTEPAMSPVFRLTWSALWGRY